nr:hypothetical protein [Variovorax sp. 38R]
MCSRPVAGTGTWTCNVPNAAGGFATVSGVPDLGPNPDFTALATWVSTNLGANAIALGSQGTKASGANAIAIGSNAGASADGAVAIGTGTQATGLNAMAAGANAATNGSNTVAVGVGAQANGLNSLSVGPNAGQGSSGAFNAAFGSQAGRSVTGTSNVALGGNAGNRVTGDFNLGVGEGAGGDVQGAYNTAQGYYAGVGVEGQMNLASGLFAGAFTKGDSNVALGSVAGLGVEANDTVSIGSAAVAGAERGIAIGKEALAGAQGKFDSIAIGTSAVSGNDAIAIGSGATASNDRAVSIGMNAGQGAGAGINQVFIGLQAGANSSGDEIVAIGQGAATDAVGSQNVSVGAQAGTRMQGKGNVNVGRHAGVGLTGDENVNTGVLSGYGSTGSGNAYVGWEAGRSAKGDDNAAVGRQAGYGVQGDANAASGYGAMYAVQGNQNTASGAVAGAYSVGNNNVASGSAAGVAIAGSNNVTIGQSAGTGYVVDTTARTFTDRNGNAITATPSAMALNDVVAIGNRAITDADRTIAIGKDSTANAVDAIAIGSGAKAVGAQSISIGTGNVVNGNNSGAIGDPSVIDAANSYSVGNNNTLGAAAANTFVLGNNVNVNVANATALGDATSVTVADGVALGSKSVASTDKGVAGFDPATGLASTDTSATWKSTLGAVSVGGNGQTRQITNVAAGTQATDAVNVAQLQATQTHYYSVNSTVTGAGSNYNNDGATGAGALAAGVGAQATGTDAVAIGAGAVSSGANGGTSGGTVAVGVKSNANGFSSVAVGDRAIAANFADVSLGSEAGFSAGTGQYNTALGAGAGRNASGDHATAVGNGALSDSNGVFNTATGTGAGAGTAGDANAAFGALAGGGVTGNNNVAVGAAAGFGVTANDTVSIGGGALASKDSAVALGRETQASAVNSVALGAESQATQDAAALALKKAYAPLKTDGTPATVAGTVPVGEVSVGSVGKERRITNLAAGSDDTDAVNVSQLKAAQTHYYSVNDNGTQGGNYANDGATGVNALAAGVGAVAGGAEDVSVGFGAGSAVSDGGNTAVGSGAGSGASGRNFRNSAFGVGAGAQVVGATNVGLGDGAGSQLEGDGNTAIGSRAGVSLKGSYNIAMGTGAGQGVDGNSNTTVGGWSGSSVKGVGNVALGAGANSDVEIDPATGRPIAMAPSVQANNTVSIGTNSRASADDAIAIGTGAQALGEKSIAIGDDAIATGSVAMGASARAGNGGAAFGDGAIATYLGGTTVAGTVAGAALGQNAKADVSAGVALGTDAEVTAANGVALGAGSTSTQDAAALALKEAYKPASAASVAGAAPVGEVSVGSVGKERRITNLAAGSDDTDAVNVSQLKAAQTHYYSVNDNGTQGGNYANDGATGVNALAAGVGAQANGERSVSIGYRAGEGASAGLAGQNNVGIGTEAGRGVVGAANTAVGSAAGKDVIGSSNAAFGIAAGQSVQGDYNLAMGVYSGIGTKGTYNTAIGGSAGQSVTGNDNIAMGDLSGASVSGDTNIGIGAVAGAGTTGSSNIAIGTFAGIVDTTTFAGITADNTVSIGNSAVASKNDGVAIGRQAQASAVNSVALGAESQATQDAAALQAKAAYAPLTAAGTPAAVAGTAPVGEVSVGSVGKERRITNLAAGSDDTDAVNVSQLKAVDATANAGWNVAANGEATGGNVAPGGKVDFSNSDSNIAITRTGTDLDFKLADDVKVNNSVTVGQSVLNTTGLTVNNGTTTTAVAAGGVTSGSVNLSGVSNDIQGLSNTTLTDPSFATVGRAATEEQLKLVNDTASAGWNVAANGEATGGNVAPGGKVDFSNSDSNIAITRTGTDLDFKLADDVKVNNSVTVGQSVLNTTGLTVNNGTTTTAVAAGGVTSGSVNLSGVSNDIKGLSNTTLTDPTFATVGRGATEEQLKLVNDTASAGWNVAANGEATGGNVAPGSKVDFSNSDSNIAITRTGTDLDFKLADDVKVNNSVTVGQSVLNTTGLTVNNGTTTTAVAAGGVTSGSVNLSGVSNDIQGLSNTTLTDPSFATVGRAATEEQLKLVDTTASKGWNVAANGEATGGNVAPGGKVDFSNSDSNIAITRTGTDLDFKLADDVKVNNSVTVGQSVLNTTGLTVNNGTTTTAVAAGGVTSGSVNLSGVSNDIQGLSNTTLTDPSFATVGRAATEEQLKLVDTTASKGWNVAANGEATGGNVAPGGKVDFSNSDSNIAITRSGTSLDFKLADDVKVNNSVTVGQSVLNTTGMTVNNGTTTTAVAAGGVTSGTVNLSGVTNDIKGLSNTTLTDPSFATVGRGATEEQLKIVNDTASAGWNVAANGEATGGNVAPGGKVDFSNSDSNIAITRTGSNLDFKLADDVKVNNSVTVGQSVLNTTGLTVNDGTGNVTKTSAAGTTVTNGTTSTVVAAGGVTSGSVNLSGVSNDIKGLSNKTLTDPSFATVGRAATEEQLKLVDATASKGWNLSANGEATPQNIAPGGTANFANGDNMVVTRNGNTLTVATAKDVTFDSVTTGDTVMNNAGVTVGPNVTLGATGLTIVGGPSMTTAGVDAGGKVITNVAPGVAGTDAVNVSQLNDTVAESKTKYYSVNSTGGGNENNDGATGTDAIAAGKDAQATAANAVAMGTAAQAAGMSATSIGNAAWAMGDRSTAVGYFSTADGIDSAAFGAWARAAGNGSVAAGVASNASGVASVAMGAVSAAVGDLSVAMGAGSTATATGGVALGAGSVADKEAGVQGYVPAGATAAQADAIAATTSTTGAVGVGDVANGVFRQITGVAAGSAPSDAVNVAQLQAVASQAAAAGSKWITGSPTTYVAPTSTGTDSTAVGSGAVVNADQGVAIGTGAVVTTKNSVALGNDATTADAKPTESVTLQGTTYQFAGTKPVGVVSVGSKDAERQLTNVAAGEISATSTDAVNGSQLNATNQAINNMTTGGGGIKYFHANSKAADSNAAGAESVAIGPNAVALGNNAIATGNGAQAKAAGSIALGANSTASTANSVALGDGAVANRVGMNGQREMFSNTVVQSAQGAVSVGSTGNERQITNVAGGTQATDAVNVRQLQAVQQSAVRYDTNVDGSVNYNSVTMGNGASTGPVTVQNVAPGVAPTDAVNVQQLNQAGAANMAYTDARTNALGSEIRNVAKNAYAGVAAAMAVQMPGTSVPGKTVMRVGYGTFKGESAVGISFRRTAENNGWSMTGGVGMSRAGAAATVGAEWVFN